MKFFSDDSMRYFKIKMDQKLDNYQAKVPAGSSDDIVTYSNTAGTFNSLTKVTAIGDANTSDTKIPTEKATAAYVQAYKPTIITQGNSDVNVAANQITFWIEEATPTGAPEVEKTTPDLVE